MPSVRARSQQLDLLSLKPAARDLEPFAERVSPRVAAKPMALQVSGRGGGGRRFLSYLKAPKKLRCSAVVQFGWNSEKADTQKNWLLFFDFRELELLLIPLIIGNSSRAWFADPGFGEVRHENQDTKAIPGARIEGGLRVRLGSDTATASGGAARA